MIGKKKSMSDETKISGTTWGELKEKAMQPNYIEKSTFVSVLLD